jgi:hypothetical protein
MTGVTRENDCGCRARCAAAAEVRGGRATADWLRACPTGVIRASARPRSARGWSGPTSSAGRRAPAGAMPVHEPAPRSVRGASRADELRAIPPRWPSATVIVRGHPHGRGHGSDVSVIDRPGKPPSRIPARSTLVLMSQVSPDPRAPAARTILPARRRIGVLLGRDAHPATRWSGSSTRSDHCRRSVRPLPALLETGSVADSTIPPMGYESAAHQDRHQPLPVRRDLRQHALRSLRSGGGELVRDGACPTSPHRPAAHIRPSSEWREATRARSVTLRGPAAPRCRRRLRAETLPRTTRVATAGSSARSRIAGSIAMRGR